MPREKTLNQSLRFCARLHGIADVGGRPNGSVSIRQSQCRAKDCVCEIWSSRVTRFLSHDWDLSQHFSSSIFRHSAIEMTPTHRNYSDHSQ